MVEAMLWQDVAYVTRASGPLGLDLYVPRGAAGPLPVVVMVPGGGWRNCEKTGLPRFLLAHGFAIAGINYRLSSVAKAPANLHDCQAAVRWVREHAATHGLDAGRIGLYGASAGGHLTALLALSGDAPELAEQPGSSSCAVQAACAVCGPSDLSRIAIAEHRAAFPLLYEVTEQYLGGPVAERAELARLVSPLTYATRPGPPLLLIHGEADMVVPVAETTILAEALSRAGQPVTTRLIPGAGHGWLLEASQAEVAAFFRRHLHGGR
jgi:acetyl esterase/lipase